MSLMTNYPDNPYSMFDVLSLISVYLGKQTWISLYSAGIYSFWNKENKNSLQFQWEVCCRNTVKMIKTCRYIVKIIKTCRFIDNLIKTYNRVDICPQVVHVHDEIHILSAKTKLCSIYNHKSWVLNKRGSEQPLGYFKNLKLGGEGQYAKSRQVIRKFNLCLYIT